MKQDSMYSRLFILLNCIVWGFIISNYEILSKLILPGNSSQSSQHSINSMNSYSGKQIDYLSENRELTTNEYDELEKHKSRYYQNVVAYFDEIYDIDSSAQ